MNRHHHVMNGEKSISGICKGTKEGNSLVRASKM